MANIERFEEFLLDAEMEGNDFAIHEYAEWADIENAEASADREAYLRYQRAPLSDALYLVQRVRGTRTRNARWAVTEKPKKMQVVGLGQAFYDDVRCKVLRALAPDIRFAAAKNPRVARIAETQLESIVEGAMRVLAGAVGMTDEDDDEL